MEGFTVCDASSARSLRKYPLHHISRWSMRGSSLVLFTRSPVSIVPAMLLPAGSRPCIVVASHYDRVKAPGCTHCPTVIFHGNPALQSDVEDRSMQIAVRTIKIKMNTLKNPQSLILHSNPCAAGRRNNYSVRARHAHLLLHANGGVIAEWTWPRQRWAGCCQLTDSALEKKQETVGEDAPGTACAGSYAIASSMTFSSYLWRCLTTPGPAVAPAAANGRPGGVLASP
jgi:hypothetical protein